jgi:putative endonuclease
MTDFLDSLTGADGESVAAQYLEKKGYRILKRNYRTSGAEVDLIAQKDDTLCFVEVKTRETDDYGLPEEFVDERKRRKIIRATKVFIGQKRYEDYFVRFDIISLLYRGDKVKIKHIKHAFED